MLATTLASAKSTVAYAEVIKRNATSSTTAMAQNYLNKGTSATTDLSYSKLLSNSGKYSFITDATLLPVLYSNWRANDIDSWYFYGDDGSVRTGWLYDNGWYYLSTESEGTVGLMKYGWYQDSDGSWYFLNTVHDGTFGRAVSGWQWIDGYSYFFDENCRLVVSGSTTDGYTVDNDGRWIVDGVVQYVEGKGLSTDIVYLKDQSHSTTTKNSYSDDSVYSSSNRADDYSIGDDKSDIDDSQEDIVDDRNENQTATPSDASPSEATSSDATSSDASEYMPYGSTYTRAEWISLLVEKIDMVLLEDDEELNHYYADTVDHEYASEIETAYAYNILPPADVEDLEQDVPLFYPDDIATREFAAYTAVRAMGFDGSHSYDISSWNDLDNLAYSNEAAIAIGYDFLSLDSSKNFNPSEPIYESDVEKIYDAIDEINDSVFISDEDVYDNTIYRENVLKDELLSLTEYEVSEEADGTYTVTMPRSDDALLITSESVIILPPNDIYHTGIALHVNSVQTIGDNMVLSARVPALEEVYVRIDFAQKGILLLDKIETADGVTVEYVAREKSAYILAGAKHIDVDFSINPMSNLTFSLVNIPIAEDVNVSGTLQIGVADFTCIIDAYIGLGEFNIEEITIALQKEIKCAAELKYTMNETGFYHTNDLGNTRFISYSTEFGRLPIAIGTTGMTFDIVLSLVVDGNGSVSVSYTIVQTQGFQYKNGAMRWINDYDDSLDFLDIRGTAKSGVKIAGHIRALGFLDLTGYAVEVGMAINISFTPHVLATDTLYCGDATLYPYITSYVDPETIYGRWMESVSHVKLETNILTKDSGHGVKLKFHIENGTITDKCTYGTGSLEGYVQSNDSKKPIENARVRVYIDDISDGRLIRTVYTDEYGKYCIDNLIKANYTIDISATGYQKYVVNDISISSIGMTQYLETNLMVDRNQVGLGYVKGTITDAVTGRGISNTSYEIRSGWNKTNGEPLQDGIFTESNYTLSIEPGNHTLKISCNDYIANYVNITIDSALDSVVDVVLNPNVSGSTSTKGDSIRIVLTWGETPTDLDSHLIGTKDDGTKSTFHTYFGEKKFYKTDGLVTVLDIDDVDGYGPETTTIYKIAENGLYEFYVYDYTNNLAKSSVALSLSNAKVQVYSGDICIATYHIPRNVEGNTWHVFDYDATTKTIIPINTFSFIVGFNSWERPTF